MTNGIIPRYYQIKETIKRWIVDKEFGPGEKIPSENELAAQFKVSRLTVRQAVSQLIQEGFLISRRGAGSFVTDNEKLINSFNIEISGFLDDLFYLAQRSTTKGVEINRIKTPRIIKAKYNLYDDSDEIIQIKRVRFIQDNSFAYSINYFPIEIGEKITQKDLFTNSILQIMIEDLGIQFTEAFQTIEASFADQEVAEKLGIASGAPVLFVERTMYIKKQIPVEFVQSSYRGDLYKYVSRLKPVRRKKASSWVSIQQGDPAFSHE